MVQEIVQEMDYLRSREQKLRDTNESTNNRVKWFAFSTMGMLVALGAWQVIYLRAYFRYVLRRLNMEWMDTNRDTDQSILFENLDCEWSNRPTGRYAIFMALDLFVLLARVVENRYIMTKLDVDLGARNALMFSRLPHHNFIVKLPNTLSYSKHQIHNFDLGSGSLAGVRYVIHQRVPGNSYEGGIVSNV